MASPNKCSNSQSSKIPVKQFAHILSKEKDWYQLGVHLDVPVNDLDYIQRHHGSDGTFKCLVKVHECLNKMGAVVSEKTLCWEKVCAVLRDMENNGLADKIHSEYIRTSFARDRDSISNGDSTHSSRSSYSRHSSTDRKYSRRNSHHHCRNSHSHRSDSYYRPHHKSLHRPSHSHVYRSFHSRSSTPIHQHPLPVSIPQEIIIEDDSVKGLAEMFEILTRKFFLLIYQIKSLFLAVTGNEGNTANLSKIEDLMKYYFGLERLPEDEATVHAVFDRLQKHCSMLNIEVLWIIRQDLPENEDLLETMKKFEKYVKNFKSSAKLKNLAALIKHQCPEVVMDGGCRLVRLKVHEFWYDLTVEQFEIMINEIFKILHKFLHHISVTKGCICIGWTISRDVNFTELLPRLPVDLVRSIGVISLHIGDEVIYNIKGDGCETIEEAMIQAVKLRTTRAVELLIAVGCRPEIAANNGENYIVTTIIDIKNKECPPSESETQVPHSVYILGPNDEQVDASLDADSEKKCTSCILKQKMNVILYQEIESLKQKPKSINMENSNTDEQDKSAYDVDEDSLEQDKPTEDQSTEEESTSEHVEATILDPSSEQECTLCIEKEKVNADLRQEINILKQKLKNQSMKEGFTSVPDYTDYTEAIVSQESMKHQEVLEAFRNGDKDKVVTLLKNTEKLEEIRSNANLTLLHYAAMYGMTVVCQLLVERYSLDPHVKESYKGWTALHLACGNSNTDTVKYLVNHAHCDPLTEDNDGRTPFDHSEEETRQFLQEIIDLSKKEGFTSVPDYTEALQERQERQSILGEAMAEGGDLFQCNIVFHGPPGAGKSSVKAVILGKPPRPKHEQTATDIVEPCVRTVKVDRVAANQQCFEEVDNDDIIRRITADVEKYRTQKKSTKAQNQPSSFYNSKSTSASLKLTLPDEATIETVESIRANLLHFSSSYKSVFDSRWLHHIDSSGLPQFLDVFPLMYRSLNSHFVVVMRLTDGLDERPKVRYYIEGNDEYCLPDQLVLSNREMIIRMCQVARRISQATGGKFTPRVFVVGTHNDKLLPIVGPMRRRSINSELLHIHEEYKDVLVCKTPGEKVMFMINAMATGEERQQHMEELQRCILSATEKIGDPVRVPLHWLILHLELNKCADIVRMEKCLELAGKIGIGKERVRAALQFLNKSALILYYPDDVPDLVIIKMDPFTSRLSKLIKASFIAPDNGPTKESDELRIKGIFKKSFLQRVFHDVADNLISDEEFLKLLESLKIAVHMGGDEYFLPSALSLEPPSGGFTFYSNSNPLALLWDELILPHGFFLTVSVELQDETGGEEGYVFQLRRDKSQWRGAIQLSEVNGQIPGVVMLTD